MGKAAVHTAAFLCLYDTSPTAVFTTYDDSHFLDSGLVFRACFGSSGLLLWDGFHFLHLDPFLLGGCDVRRTLFIIANWVGSLDCDYWEWNGNGECQLSAECVAKEEGFMVFHWSCWCVPLSVA